MATASDEWELTEEDIQHLQKGRKPEVSNVALSSNPEDLILQQRRAFETELRTYTGADPLPIWCKYIKWVEQNYPKGGREHSAQLIQQCLSILKEKIPDTRKAIAYCADLLPLKGKEAVYDCGRNVSEEFQDNMFVAADKFCDREDIRDLLFLCWEKGLSELYETSREEVEEENSKDMNDFQVCLQEILDGLFED